MDWTDRQKSSRLQAAHTSYQKRLNKVLSFVVMGESKDFLCISLCRVWTNVCVHVCKTTNWLFICLIMCNCIYIVISNCGWNNNVAVKIVACWNWNIYYIFMTRYTVSLMRVTQPEGILSDRPSFEWVQVGQFCPLKLTFSNSAVPDSMQVCSPYICR